MLDEPPCSDEKFPRTRKIIEEMRREHEEHNRKFYEDLPGRVQRRMDETTWYDASVNMPDDIRTRRRKNKERRERMERQAAGLTRTRRPASRPPRSEVARSQVLSGPIDFERWRWEEAEQRLSEVVEARRNLYYNPASRRAQDEDILREEVISRGGPCEIWVDRSSYERREIGPQGTEVVYKDSFHAPASYYDRPTPYDWEGQIERQCRALSEKPQNDFGCDHVLVVLKKDAWQRQQARRQKELAPSKYGSENDRILATSGTEERKAHEHKMKWIRDHQAELLELVAPEIRDQRPSLTVTWFQKKTGRTEIKSMTLEERITVFQSLMERPEDEALEAVV